MRQSVRLQSVHSDLHGYPEPFKGTARTPTVGSGRGCFFSKLRTWNSRTMGGRPPKSPGRGGLHSILHASTPQIVRVMELYCARYIRLPQIVTLLSVTLPSSICVPMFQKIIEIKANLGHFVEKPMSHLILPLLVKQPA